MCAIDSSSDEPDQARVQTQQIVEFWSQLRVGGETGATTWDVLESIELKVTDCLARRPPDVANAGSLTAFAMLLITGGSEL